MKIEELIEEYQKMGIELFLDKENLKFKAPKGVMTSEIKEVLKKNKQQIIEYLLREKEIKPNAEHKYNPFPLTDVQAAYMLGNSSVYEFGGFSCHTYFEVKTDFTDISILEKAWNKVIEKHDMLRAVIYEEGYQVIQKEVPWQKVLLNSIVTKPIEKQDQCIAEVRSRLAQKKYDVGEWPLCELEATFFDDGMCILHFSIDMMISDFISTNIILKDLVFYYNHPDAESVPFSISYRDIVLYQNQMQYSEKYLIDKEYWMKRIEHLPVELDLPMCISSDKKQQIKFIQFNTRVAAEKWIAVKNELYKARITPSSFILTVYASVLGKWIRNKNFCINVTLLNRPDYDENIQNIVGDFTTTNILQVDLKNKTENFKEKILTIQEQLWRDIEHSMFSGVQVIREMTRQTKSHVIVPIVFTSMLGMENSISKIANTSVEYKISQTPQVWIDCQVSEINEELLINWDVRNDIFPEGMINDIFNAFENVLMLFCKNYEFMDKTLIVPLPDETKKVRVKVNKTKKEFVAKTLHSGYVNTLKSRPNHIAFIYDHKKYTYHDLEKYISAIQSKLIACGCEKKDYVAVILPKGIWQVAATIGTLALGCSYVPISLDNPYNRICEILDEVKAKAIVTDTINFIGYKNVIYTASIEPAEKNIVVEDVTPDQIAYVIYTSGSTGSPKGVVITHQAAYNTIQDINARFNIADDVVALGLAKLSFDLSVFDLFGIFKAGGVLVYPKDEDLKNPYSWIELMETYHINLLNMVPAQMQMMTMAMESRTDKFDFVKTIMMSGDWIPVSLPEAINQVMPNAKIISLGGATEASIWSIYYEIDQIQKNWKSIPYGYPLSNQKFYILDDKYNDCPNYVPGKIFISGRGLAEGYYKRNDLTMERFKLHPVSGERIYYTGDIGCYHPEGWIEFLGRDDTQIKVNGHRIELQEIEKKISNYARTEMVVVDAVNTAGNEKKLAAFIVPEEKDFSTKEAEAYGIECAETAKCLMKNIDRNLFEEWVAAADKKSLLDIVYALQSRGIFVNKSSLWDFKQIRDKLGVLPKYDFLLTRWLEALCKEEYLVSIGNQVFQANVELISNAEINESWNRLQNIENKLHYSQMLIEYFKNSGEHLLDFLSGNKDPLSILFPEGKTQTALAAYRNNIVNTNINQVIIKYVNSIARQLNAQGKQLHILEVGAGVGGTSRDLIPSLKNKNVEYWFTDISTFFLNSAKETFADYKNVTYRLFDINQDYREQDIPAVYFDVLLCANVLHNAHNGMEVMKQLKEVMRENASFIIIEETVESYAIMTSMEFEYSINDITDYRKEINHIFFNREQWRKLLDQVNARIVCELPGIDDKLSLAGQCLFIASVWKGRKDIEKGKLLNYLEQELPVYEIPQYIEIVSKIDLSTNGKVDRKKLKIHMEESEKDTNEDSKILPSTEQEKILVEIWKEVLNRENISITDNFYELGGDSLLVAQTISQVKKRLPLAKEYQWNELMRKMLENPTIEGFAKVFEDVKYVKESEDNELVRLNFVRNGNDNKIIVLYPDGINSLSQYNGLINKIQEEFGSYTIIGVNLCENQVFFETAPECLIPDIGKVIAQKLMQAYSKCEIVLIGYCIGGLMAIETGRFLLEQGKNVNGIVTIDTRTCSRCIDNDLIMERIFKIILNGGEQDKLMDQQISDAVRAVLTDKKSAITNEELCNCGEQFSEVNKYFTELCTLSPKQRFDSLLDYQKIELDEERNRILNLYRMFRHNYRGVMNYAQDFYIGDVLALQCNDNTGFFLPAEMIFDSDFLQQTVLGNLSYEAIPGNHLTCLDNNNIPLIYGYIRKYLS